MTIQQLKQRAEWIVVAAVVLLSLMGFGYKATSSFRHWHQKTRPVAVAGPAQTNFIVDLATPPVIENLRVVQDPWGSNTFGEPFMVLPPGSCLCYGGSYLIRVKEDSDWADLLLTFTNKCSTNLVVEFYK